MFSAAVTMFCVLHQCVETYTGQQHLAPLIDASVFSSQKKTPLGFAMAYSMDQPGRAQQLRGEVMAQFLWPEGNEEVKVLKHVIFAMLEPNRVLRCLVKDA
ncbi:hypothetical protein EON65_47035 [archaeon]|nr:MAG: hypothetical protein EON65_47035 [archaeon]